MVMQPHPEPVGSPCKCRPPIYTNQSNIMIIKKATLSQNDHNKLVESLAVLFGTGNPSNIIKGIAMAACCQTANLNDKAMEDEMIDPKNMGSLSALSPMEIATTVDVLMSVAYQAGLKAGKESKS